MLREPSKKYAPTTQKYSCARISIYTYSRRNVHMNAEHEAIFLDYLKRKCLILPFYPFPRPFPSSLHCPPFSISSILHSFPTRFPSPICFYEINKIAAKTDFLLQKWSCYRFSFSTSAIFNCKKKQLTKTTFFHRFTLFFSWAENIKSLFWIMFPRLINYNKEITKIHIHRNLLDSWR